MIDVPIGAAIAVKASKFLGFEELCADDSKSGSRKSACKKSFR